MSQFVRMSESDGEDYDDVRIFLSFNSLVSCANYRNNVKEFDMHNGAAQYSLCFAQNNRNIKGIQEKIVA